MQHLLTVIITAFIAFKSFAQDSTLTGKEMDQPIAGCGISVTSPNFRGKDSATWCDPSIKSWRPRGGDHAEQRYIIRGTINNPPEGGYITLSVIVDREYAQPGKFGIDTDNTWVGELFLRTSDSAARNIKIVVSVNNNKREIIKKCHFFIISCK